MSRPLSVISIADIVKFDDFVLSTRGKMDEKIIKNKIDHKEIPLIIDLAINGYSNKPGFEIEVNNVKFSDFKNKCSDNAKDGESLTVKRACRVTRFEINEYIKSKRILTPLYKQFAGMADLEDDSVNEYSFIGGEHLVPQKLSKELYTLWTLFDHEKKTKISESVKRVLEARFDRLKL